MEDAKQPEELVRDAAYWMKFIKSAKRAARRHWRDSREAYAEYELPEKDEVGGKERLETPKGYHIYAESSWQLEPSLYCKEPDVVADRLHESDDPLPLTMEFIVQKLGQHLVDHGSFNETMLAARGDYMHASKATTQVIYATEFKDPIRVPLTPMMDGGGYMGPDNQKWAGEAKDEGGQFYGETPVVNEETQRVFCKAVLFDEVLHTPRAKDSDEIKEIAYKFSMDKATAEEKFNPDGTKSLVYKKEVVSESESADGDKEKKSEDAEGAQERLEGWEIYCFASKKIYWMSESNPSQMLCEPQPDLYGLKGFFPSPKFQLKNRRRQSLFPTPVFTYLKATAEMLHVLYERIWICIDAIRPRALVYGASPELIDALNNLKTATYISVAEVDDILSAGGIKNLVEFVPVQDLIQAINQAMILEESFAERFNVGYGTPDIMKGISDPRETAEAQDIKSEAGNNRFKCDKKNLNDLGRDTAEMMLDLALKVYSSEKIKKICGFEYLPMGDPGKPEVPPGPPNEQNPEGSPGEPAVPPTPGHRELFDLALAKLQNDTDRMVTIKFETDSTSFQDEKREIQKAQIISQTVTQGLAAIGGMQNQEFAPIMVDMLLSQLEPLGGSTRSENMIKKAVKDLEQKKKQPPPPPPDPAMLKLEIDKSRVELDRAKFERESARKDFEVQLKQMEVNGKVEASRIEASLTQQIEGMKLALANKDQQIEEAKRVDKAQMDMLTLQMKSQELENNRVNNERNNQVQLLQIENEKKTNELYAMLEQQRVQIERDRVRQEEMLSKFRVIESFMEENRLKKDRQSNEAMEVLGHVANQNAIDSAVGNE